MSVDQKSEELVRLISNFTGINPTYLIDNCSIFHDLNLAGDDGAELLDVICKSFKIDMKDIDSSRYFGSEAAYNPIYHFYGFIRGKKLDYDIVRLEIVDLKRTVESGVWQEPIA